MKRIKFAIIWGLFPVITGCTSNNSEQKKIVSTNATLSELKPNSPQESKQENDNEFDLFFKKFETNRDFQLSRIKFPLNVLSDRESKQIIKSMTKSQWTYTNFSRLKNIEIKKKNISENKIDVTLSIIDTGVQVIYHFKIINREWWLSEITDLSD